MTLPKIKYNQLKPTHLNGVGLFEIQFGKPLIHQCENLFNQEESLPTNKNTNNSSQLI